MYNLLLGDGAWNYRYDPNLNLNWKNNTANTVKWNYQWNSLNQLTKAVKWTYDSKKKVWTSSTIGEYYYDANGARARAVESGVTTEYVYRGHDPMCEKTGTTYTDYVYVNGKLKEKLVGSTIYHYLVDPGIGSTWQVWKDGATSATFSVKCYKPFGTPYTPSGTEKVKYAGEILDASTGLYYIFSRYMDPELGRWLSPDPELGKLSSPQTLNRYVYCVNNPLRFTDPTGEGIWSWVKSHWKEIAVTALAIALAATGVGLVASVVLLATTQAAFNAADVIAKGGDLQAIGKAAALGFVEGAATGVIGAGVGKLALAGLKSVMTGAAKTALQGVGSKLLSSLGKGIGKIAPGIGRKLEQKVVESNIRAGMNLLARMGNRMTPGEMTVAKGQVFDAAISTKVWKPVFPGGSFDYLIVRGAEYRATADFAGELVGLLTMDRVKSLSSYEG